MLQIKGWDEWQTYRQDRGTPPWIKVHRKVMTNRKWAQLSDAEKGQLVSIWVAAADNEGKVPQDPAILRKVCQLDSNPNVKKFIELGFLTTICQPDDASLTPERLPDDAPEAEAETYKQETEKTPLSGKPDHAAEIINYLNNKTERNFKPTPKHRGLIQARIKEGYSARDFETVIDKMVSQWVNDPKMYKYLRPITLFSTKFDGYLNLPDTPPLCVEPKTSFEKKRDVADEWLEESLANDKKRISDGDKGLDELRGSEAGQGNAGGLVPHVRDGPPW